MVLGLKEKDWVGPGAVVDEVVSTVVRSRLRFSTKENYFYENIRERNIMLILIILDFIII